MSDEPNLNHIALLSRLDIDEDQYSKASTVMRLMTKDCNLSEMSRDLGVSLKQIKEKRQDAVRMFHLANKLIDDEHVEKNGSLPATINEAGVGEFSNFTLGQAVFETFDTGKSVATCANKFGVDSPDLVEWGREFFARLIFYMASEAIKASPYLSVTGILNRFSNVEDFVELRTLAENYLQEDDAEYDAESDNEVSDDSDSIDFIDDDPDNFDELKPD